MDTPRAVHLGREAITPEIRHHLFEDYLFTSCSILNHSTDLIEALILACLEGQSQAAIQAYVAAHSLHQTKEAPSESLFSAASIFPALGDKRNKFLAPRPTSQCAVERAMPPAPLTTNYDASGLRRISAVLHLGLGTTCPGPPAPTDSTTFPICAPDCIYIGVAHDVRGGAGAYEYART